MSSEWPLIRMGECVDLFTGFPFKSADYTDGDASVRLLRGDNIAQGQLRWDGVKKWPSEKCGGLAKYELKEGDIVLAMDRPWIPAGLKFGNVRKADLPALLVQRVARLRPTESIRADFLYCIIAGRGFSEYIQNVTTGTAVPHISARQIKEFQFRLPDLQTQERIGGMLAALDDRIALLRETNTTLEAIGQALFKSWFVDFDPVRAKAEGREPEGLDADTAALFPDGFEESELGMVPRGWSVGKVHDLVELAYGKALKATDRIKGAVPVYGSGGITGFHNEPLVQEPSIIVGRKGTVGSLYWEDQPFFPIDTVFYVKSELPLSYCFYLLQTLGLDGMNTDGAVPGLNRNNVYRLPVVIPSEAIIFAFNDTVTALRNRIFLNIEGMRTLASIRDTLLPRLISGQLRLPDAEAMVSDAT
ncbi:restriction endonuclease subunit S [Pandoraea sputorum]|uniref:restriction endonuclease subunit S n=1 Tax=Pandoraea sputorum TaxID=93222 RepID=UPI001E2AF163|nr:restriction endonuclease subunit S [Pandoraea sputorum]MCE4059314.1 restriction endonuclease subunit S [Pandoraea sputorum]